LPKRSEIEAAARQTYGLLTARHHVPGKTLAQQRARVAQADAQYSQQAAALSQILLGPVASQLGKKRLLIVADGALQYVSFAALPAPMVVGQLSVLGERVPASMENRQATIDYQPLVIEHEIVSLPSASVLAKLRQETVGRSPAAKAVLVLADPVFEKDDPRVKVAKGQTAQSERQSL
jgi:CHAT domain-containing protein